MKVWCVVLSAALLLPSAFAAKRRAVRVSAPPPSIEAITPAEGPIAGGTEVVIRGIGFTADSRVTVAGTPVPTARVVSFSEVHLTTLATPNGIAAVAVENANGRATSEFLFVPPSLASVGRGVITTVAGIGSDLVRHRSEP